MVKSLLFLTISLSFSFASAQSRTEDYDYSFGGSCASTGSWTQKALAKTAEIKSIIKRLRDVPECKVLGALLDTTVQKGTQDLTEQSGIPVAQQMENIPNRESALATYADMGGPDFKTNVLQALLKERFNLATANSYNTIRQGFGSANGMIGSSIANDAAALINTVTQSLPLPQFDGCLLHHREEIGSLIAPIVGLSANIIGPTGGINSTLTGAIHNLIRMLQVPAFGGVLKVIDKTQFWTSMSCLLESTAEAYCSVIDAKHLLNKDYLAQKVKVTDGKASFGNPLNGYEVLVLHVPNIAAWVQKVQFGIEPQWDTDAKFKISAFENTANYMTSAWNILGTFNGLKNVLKQQPDNQSKKNFLLEMLRTVVTGIQRGAQSVDFTTMGSDLNFYTQVQQRDAIPFYLIGMQDGNGNGQIPAGAIRNKFGGAALDWEKYLKGDGSFRNPDDPSVERIWSDPETLAKAIESNLRTLIIKANDRASTFYQDRIIVNQPNLVAQAVSSPQFTVHHSFQFLNGYLGQLEKMFTQVKTGDQEDQEHKHLIGLIRYLKYRITKALAAFDELKKLEGVKISSDKDRDQIEQVYKTVVQTVYKEFDVLYQRDSFISSALVELVKADYGFRIRNNVGFGEYEKNLIIASGDDFINLIRTLHGFNPVRAMGDISTAMIVNENNLNAIELAFGDPLMRTLDEINMYIKGESVGDMELNRRSMKRLVSDTFKNGVAERDNYGWSTVGKLFGWVGAMFVQDNLRPDRYQFPRGADRIVRPHGDPEGGWQYFRDQLCILSLAFVNKTDYSDLCKGAVLPSLYDGKNPKFKLNAAYDDLLDPSNSRDEKGQVDKMLYKENTICAFRNYHRKNLVFRLTEHLKAGIEQKDDFGN